MIYGIHIFSVNNSCVITLRSVFVQITWIASYCVLQILADTCAHFYFLGLLPAPSSFGCDWEKDVKKHNILIHRPSPEMCGNHVALYFQGFDKFLRELNMAQPVKEDTKFVMTLVNEMCKYFPTEKDRRVKFLGELNRYMSPLKVVEMTVPNTSYRTDGCITMNTVYDVALILKAKREVGHGHADSLMEAIGYYYHFNQYDVDEKKRLLPCFIMELIGPHMGIYGACTVGGIIHVDKLSVTHWLCCQPTNRFAMLQIAKCFKALKTVLQGEFNEVCLYQDFPLTFGFPISFQEQIKRHTFKAIYNQKNAIVKFVECYGEDVHQFCASKSFAPTLFFCKQVTLHFKMVVMEEISNATPLHDYVHKDGIDKGLLKKKCLNILQQMHAEGFCHGDFRSNNLLVVDEDNDVSLYLIDFDWAGKAGEAKYPYFMNHFQIDWPNGASDGEPLQPSHDLHFLEQIFEH